MLAGVDETLWNFDLIIAECLIDGFLQVFGVEHFALVLQVLDTVLTQEFGAIILQVEIESSFPGRIVEILNQMSLQTKKLQISIAIREVAFLINLLIIE